MPEIQIHYRDESWQDGLHDREVRELVEFLSKECARRFSTARLTLKPNDFCIYTHILSSLDLQEKDVVVSVTLYSYPERLNRATQDVAGLAKRISEQLNRKPRQLRGQLKIGVRLLYTEVVWISV